MCHRRSGGIYRGRASRAPPCRGVHLATTGLKIQPMDSHTSPHIHNAPRMPPRTEASAARSTFTFSADNLVNRQREQVGCLTKGVRPCGRRAPNEFSETANRAVESGKNTTRKPSKGGWWTRGDSAPLSTTASDAGRRRLTARTHRTGTPRCGHAKRRRRRASFPSLAAATNARCRGTCGGLNARQD